MSRLIRAAVSCALAALLAACAYLPTLTPHPATAPAVRPAPAQPAPRPAPRPAAPAPEAAPAAPAPTPAPAPGRERMLQVEQRIELLRHHIDARVTAGKLPPLDADALRHRLDVIHQEASDMAAPHASNLSVDEQHLLNQELDTAAHAIDQ